MTATTDAPSLYRCRTCTRWRSDGGQTGACTMPATDATVNCSTTAADDGCEQWCGATPFRYERDPNPRTWHPWVVRHACGLPAGTFRYRDSAKAAVAAMNAVGECYRIDTAAACNEPATRAALLAARVPHDEADRERWLAVYR